MPLHGFSIRGPHAVRAALGLGALTLAGGLATACTDVTAPLPTEPIPTHWQLVGTGQTFSCGLDPDGFAYCWGSLDATHPWPTRASTTLQFDTLAVGEHQACGVSKEGPTYCWGSGTLGDGSSYRNARVPARVAFDGTFTALTIGLSHSCALAADGAAWCWGTNGNGELGVSTLDAQRVPVPVSGGLKFRSIAAGGSFTCGVTTAGETWCWGFGDESLGVPHQPDINRLDTPVRVDGAPDFRSLVASFATRCGISSGDDLYCWGQFFVDHEGGSYTASYHPTPVLAGIHFNQVSPGRFHGCAVATDQSAWCWGHNAGGELGTSADVCDEQRGDCRTATIGRIETPLLFKSISAGLEHTCGVTTDGEGYCWGSNTWGELGSGVRGATSTPLRIGTPP